MSTAPIRRLTPAEYLAAERASDRKHEFYRGEMFAMAGASRKHVAATGNFFAWLHNQLRDTPCSVYTSDMRVLVDRTGLYTYPDISVTCEHPEFVDGLFDTLLNPQMIVEVLSPSTETYDRGKKFDHYRQVASLKEYVLVSLDQPMIERYTRVDEDRWTLDVAKGLEATVELGVTGTALPLAEVYRRVDFSVDE
jgi:Uma2 family endonuclease